MLSLWYFLFVLILIYALELYFSKMIGRRIDTILFVDISMYMCVLHQEDFFIFIPDKEYQNFKHNGLMAPVLEQIFHYKHKFNSYNWNRYFLCKTNCNPIKSIEMKWIEIFKIHSRICDFVILIRIPVCFFIWFSWQYSIRLRTL